MSELPEGWAVAPLNELAAVSGGIQKQPSRAPRSNTAPFLRVANVGSGRFDLADVHDIEISTDELERYRLLPGDLLVVEGNGSASQIGRAARWTGAIDPCVHQNHLIRVRPGPAIDSRLLELAWMGPVVRNSLRSMASSTSGLLVLTTKKVGAVELPLPPIAEQRRIVEAIEEAFSKLDAGEAGLRRVRHLLQWARHSILADAVAGRLVQQDSNDTPAAKLLADRGAQPLEAAEVPSGWAVAELGDILDTIEAGRSFATSGAAAQAHEIGVIKVSAMTWGEFRPDENKALPADTAIEERWTVRAGDLLFSRANTADYVGACVLVSRDHENLILSDKSLRLKTGDGVDRRWLMHTLRSRTARRQIEVLATGTKESMRNISQAKLRSLRLPIPPVEEQVRIADEVERQLSYLDACEKVVDAGLARSAGLRRSVLKAAFEGRLVPQHPSDEPASALLDRIRAERPARPTTTPRARQTA